jgi:putative ATPase
MAARKGPPPGPTLLEARLAQGGARAGVPLADRMRPESLEEVLGQRHLLGPGRFLFEAIRGDRVPSLILWGPPGSGKTTLAQVIAHATRSEFVPFSAVLGGVAEVREIVAQARERRSYQGRATTLFVDEIHRFNKSQQDAFLPHVENGTIVLIGATTENPSFAVNAAILSRCKVFRLEALPEGEVVQLLARALADERRGLGRSGLEATEDALELLARASSGDARRALNLLESAAGLVERAPGKRLDRGVAERALEERTLLYDKSGDEHYDVVSALIKSMRGSDPDAAIYWLMRMLDAGDDPAFVLRRLIIFASEDVGNADPRALSVAVDADSAFRRMGMPEGIYPIAQACLYLACCPKSNAVKRAWQGARELINQRGALPVPKKLRNAPTALARSEGHGEDYQYPHDFPSGYVPGETYLPEALVGTRLYRPSTDGLEKAIGERLARLRGLSSEVRRPAAPEEAPPAATPPGGSSEPAGDGD